MQRVDHRFVASNSAGEVSAVYLFPESPASVLLFAHGAGVPMDHAFMASVSERLAHRDIATLRFNFPYTERGGRRPDPQPILISTVRNAASLADELAGGLPLFAGGKSMGGRMTSTAQSKEPLPGVRGLIFFGFPLHPAKQPGTERADHLKAIDIPMLFLQGTRDKLAELELLRPVCEKLGDRTTVHIVEDGDHSFGVRKKSGRTEEEVLDELADTVRSWIEKHLENSKIL